MRKYFIVPIIIILFCLLIPTIKIKPETNVETDKVQITLMHGLGSSNIDEIKIRDIYKKFELKYPQYKIVLETYPSVETVLNRAQKMLLVDRAPDIINTSGNTEYLRNAIKRDKAVDLMPYLKKDKEFYSDINPQIIENWSKDGRIYTITDEIDITGIWCNTKILKNMGCNIDTTAKQITKTWTGFFELTKIINSYIESENLNCSPLSIYNNFTIEAVIASFLSEDILAKNPNFNSYDLSNDQQLKISEFLKIIKKYNFKMPNYNDTDAIYNFCHGNTVMLVGTAKQRLLLSDSSFIDDMYFFNFPTNSGENINHISASSGYVVGKNGEEKVNASVDFIKYMVSDDVQRQIYSEAFHVPQNPTINLNTNSENILNNAVNLVDNFGKRISNLQTINKTTFLKNIKEEYNILKN